MSGIYADQPISTVIDQTENAEEVFEELAIDYWFGADRTLRAACEARGLDAAAIEARLRPRATPVAQKTLLAAIEELDHHFDEFIRPSVLALEEASCSVKDRRGELLKVVTSIDESLSQHVQAVREELLPSLMKSGGEVGIADAKILRQVALEHDALTIQLKKLSQVASRLATEGTPEAAAVARSIGDLARHVHHHIRIAYHDLMPPLVARAAAAKPTGYEPW